MSATVSVLCLMNCVEWVEQRLQRVKPEAQPWVRITLESARREAGAAFEALRSAARHGDPEARAALDAFVASLAIAAAQDRSRKSTTLR